jgi:hypothetical protein
MTPEALPRSIHAEVSPPTDSYTRRLSVLFFLSALITGAYCRSILRGTCFVSKGFSSTHVPQTDAKAPQLEQLGSKSFDLMMFMFLTGVATNHS